MSEINCLLCQNLKENSEIITLNCNHSYCWTCMNNYLCNLMKAKMKCPENNCSAYIRDSKIRRVLSAENIEKYEAACIVAIKEITKSHKCILPECSHSIIYTNRDIQYACPSCTLYNCIQCNAAHNFISCEQYILMSESEKKDVCQDEILRAKYEFKLNKIEENKESLLSMENLDLLTNDAVFTCFLCSLSIGKQQGVKFRNCSHNICRSCLVEYVNGATKIPVECPFYGCENTIMDREIQTVLSKEDLKIYLSKSKSSTKKKFVNYFQCQTPNCDAFYDFVGIIKDFKCRACGALNCVKCRAIHNNESCEEYYQKKLSDCTLTSIDNKLKSGKIMQCPGCKSYLEKIRGCNWIQCQTCYLELCWILKIPRWGPKGRNDVSGGCKCGVNGRPCHPDCFSSCTPHSSYTNSLFRGTRH